MSMTVTSGQTYSVPSGHTDVGDTVDSGGTLEVNGGTISGTQDQGEIEIFANGTASGTILSSGGGQYIYIEGTASGTIVSGGGTEYVVGTDGVARGTIVSSGGVQYVQNATASGTIVSNGGDCRVEC